MPWVRIDDGFPDHPKVAAVGPVAGWLHVCALAYCNRNLTDGFVPAAVARRLVDLEHEDVEIDARPGAIIGRLLEAGIWHEEAGGYRIHDYTDYQPTREQVERERERWAERKRKSRAKSRESHEPVTAGSPRDSQGCHGPPVPVPVPVPKAEVSDVASMAVGSSLAAAAEKSLEEAIDLDRQRELQRLDQAVKGDDRTLSVLRSNAQGLPVGAIAKVRESCELYLAAKGHKPGAGYAVNALRSEREERGAA